MLKKITSLCLCIMLLLAAPVSSFAQAQGAAQKAGVDDTGFRWIPWLSAGEDIWKAVIRINPKLKEIIGTGDMVAVAILDLNYDGSNDIVLSFRGDEGCGVDGCMYLVMKKGESTQRGYIAKRFERRAHGISIDGRYMPL